MDSSTVAIRVSFRSMWAPSSTCPPCAEGKPPRPCPAHCPSGRSERFCRFRSRAGLLVKLRSWEVSHGDAEASAGRQAEREEGDLRGAVEAHDRQAAQGGPE